jgi:NAD(P)-dependent dehydrogenase (short-subunit alcohol dehydrogenase family)
MFDFRNKRVLVVGGSSGIGEGTAKAFAESGADVMIASRHQSKLEAAAARIGHHVAIAQLDTTNEGAVQEFFENAAPFDHVVVSAAQTSGGPVRQLPLDKAYEAMNSKFWGAYRVARAARINEGGTLTLISGYLSVRPAHRSCRARSMPHWSRSVAGWHSSSRPPGCESIPSPLA